VIWCLDEFTSDNGATRVIPGSHLAWEGDPAGTADDDKHPHVVLTAPRGAAIVFNTKLIHAGTRNTTVTPRRSLHGQYVVAGRPTHSNWRSLPDGVRRVLSPGALALMGLESAEVIGGAP
jgi:ectoine hydroxylase-related dioxygenase (phytanoyl-CoA dioxygenase family)